MTDILDLRNPLVDMLIGLNSSRHQGLNVTNPNFPPHDVIKIDNDTYVVSVAVAGYTKDALNVIIENDQLFVSGKIERSADTPQHAGGLGR